MKYLRELLEKEEMASRVRERMERFNHYADTKLLPKVPMDENAQMMLGNHIYSLIRRIEDEDFVDDVDEDMLSEVSKQAFDYAHEAVDWLFTESGLDIKLSEVFLVGTHIEMALQNAAQNAARSEGA